MVLLALAFVLGLFALPRAHPVVLGAALAALVICLDGVTVFIEPLARFPTAYQIAGFVEFISKTGHAAPGLAAYFSWPGFFALISFVTGAAGTHGLLALLRVWPVVIDLLCLPPLFLLMRNLRISWRARWLAGFLFVVGQLGRPGLLLPAVVQLPALPGVPGHPGELVHRPGPQPDPGLT